MAFFMSVAHLGCAATTWQSPSLSVTGYVVERSVEQHVLELIHANAQAHANAYL